MACILHTMTSDVVARSPGEPQAGRSASVRIWRRGAQLNINGLSAFKALLKAYKQSAAMDGFIYQVDFMHPQVTETVHLP
mmetsp:Transcript_11605/g.22052  ORF Transcript_11605/g.22052 Transcript_11605/m.22052 type:complete len:80 (-) Transcript_11605:283-522(-)